MPRKLLNTNYLRRPGVLRGSLAHVLRARPKTSFPEVTDMLSWRPCPRTFWASGSCAGEWRLARGVRHGFPSLNDGQDPAQRFLLGRLALLKNPYPGDIHVYRAASEEVSQLGVSSPPVVRASRSTPSRF